MSNYNSLKATINANIKQNGNQEITGNILNSVLNAMVNTLGAGYQYAGVATPSSNPGTPDTNVFYIAATAGTYSNMGGLVVADGELCILKYNGTWTKDVTGGATYSDFSALRSNVISLDSQINGVADSLQYTLEDGYVSGQYGTDQSNANWKRTNYIDVRGLTRIQFLGAVANSGTTVGYSFYRANNSAIPTTYDVDTSLTQYGTREYSIDVPADAVSVRISVRVNVVDSFYINGVPSTSIVSQIESIISDLETLETQSATKAELNALESTVSEIQTDLNSLDRQINGGETNLQYTLEAGYVDGVYGTDKTGAWKRTNYVNVQGLTRIQFLGAVANSGTTVGYSFYDANNTAIPHRYTEDSSITPSFAPLAYDVDVPTNAVTFRASLKADWEGDFYIRYQSSGISQDVEQIKSDLDNTYSKEETRNLDLYISSARKYGYMNNINQADLWERGGIATNGANMSTNADNARNLRTKTFIPSEIRFVHIPDTWRLDVFIYSSDGTFEQVVPLANKKYALLGIDKKYRLQLKNQYGSTDVIPEEDYAMAFLLTAKSMFEKPIRWGDVDFSTFYRGRLADYSVFNYSATYDYVIEKFDEVADTAPNYVTVTELGLSSNNKIIKSYDLKPFAVAREFENYGSSAEGRGSTGANCEAFKFLPTFIFICGQHGFEKSSSFAMYYLMKDLIENWDQDEVLRYLRNNVRIIIVPAINSWGIDNNSYLNANGVNLNRNWWSPNWAKYTGDNPSEATGDAPFDQPETVIARDLILSHPEALSVVDFHTAGSDSVPNVRSHFWAQLAIIDDQYYGDFMEACASHVRNITILNKIYNLGFADNAPLGHITWENGNIGRLFQWATHMNFLGVTFEGFNGFYGQPSYTANAEKANSESVGNWIMSVIRAFNK